MKKFRDSPQEVCSDILVWCFIELPKINPKVIKTNIDK